MFAKRVRQACVLFPLCPPLDGLILGCMSRMGVRLRNPITARLNVRAPHAVRAATLYQVLVIGQIGRLPLCVHDQHGQLDVPELPMLLCGSFQLS